MMWKLGVLLVRNHLDRSRRGVKSGYLLQGITMIVKQDRSKDGVLVVGSHCDQQARDNIV